MQSFDPTTYSNQPASQLVATQVAYKPIGITDYARFETNIDKRNDTANLGVPSTVNNGNIVTPGVFDFNLNNGNPPLQQYALTTVYGQSDAYLLQNGKIYSNPTKGTGLSAPTGYTLVAGGGSIRANMPLRFYGLNMTYLNRDPATTAQDAVEVAGNLLLNDYVPNGSATNTSAMNFGPGSGEPSALEVLTAASAGGPLTMNYAAPSNAAYGTPANPTKAPFSTNQGAVRDGGTGSNASDPEGNPRSIARLDPPVIDAVSSATNLTRYQDITENSPGRANTTTLAPGTTAFSDPANTTTGNAQAGLQGWGQSIYVNNAGDVQRDSSNLVGGHTLVDEWLNRNSGGQTSITAKSGWQGPFYNPPGVDITFGPQTSNGTANAFYGVRLTRSDVDPTGKPALWANPDGSTGTSPTLLVSYADLNATNNPATDPAMLTGAALAEYHANPNNDVVIYAEGNIRVRPSVISDAAGNPVHVTLITNGTAYIEGSVLKGNADSSITILAKDYVCLNTTQFYAGAIADEDSQSAQMPRASVAGSELLDFAADSDVLVQDFNFTPAANQFLYVSGGPSATGAAAVQFDFVDPVTGFSVIGNGTNPPFAANPPPISALFDSGVGAGLVGNAGAGAGASGLTHITFALPALPAAPLQLWTRRGPGQDQLNNNPNVSTVLQDYVQERAAILPGDIKIQAILYAQDKSFFVIPGPWFNSDAGDNLQNFMDSANNATSTSPLSRPGIAVNAANAGRFPFYGQPVDLKITVDGTVSEAHPADISAQAAWMQKWGWIPQYHGSNLGLIGTNTTTAAKESAGHVNSTAANTPAVGLTLVYDPLAGYPYDANPSTGGAYYLRSDAYGRPLPFTPKLPVGTGLLYSGQGDPQAAL